MNGKDIKIIIKTALSLFLICAVASGILAFINSVTQPIITTNNEKTADEARLAVLPEAKAFVNAQTEDNNLYYVGKDGENTIGFVFTTSASGYGGAVEVMTGINTDGAITGISILTINETPGLGMNATKDSFLSQYINQNKNLTVVKNKTPDNGEILAITSATITTNAVTSAVNKVLDLYNQVKEG